MKNMPLILLFFSLTVSARADAQELKISDITSEPSPYIGKQVVVRGSFLYKEPMRESFTIGQNGSTIEVFYYDLTGSDKQFILTQKNYSKTELAVAGILQHYTNSAGAYFIKATSLRYEKAASPVPSGLRFISYEEIAADPGRYLKSTVTMKGHFLFSEPARQSFSFEQAGNVVEVLISDLSRIDRELIFGEKQSSKRSVVVTGILQPYVNSEKKYYINAYWASLEN